MTSQRNGPMHLGLFLKATGHHIAAWHHPGVALDAINNVSHFIELAKAAERAAFDFVFFADSLGVREGAPDYICNFSQFIAYLEPLTMLSAMATHTKSIGLVSTASTSYQQPYNVARLFASLDHISNGRAGWNVVTSVNEAEGLNFGAVGHYGHDERYARAEEFVDIVKGLWNSWDDKAFINDRSSGRFFDPAALHTLDHHGKYYDVRGPLNIPRPPQGHPVIFQAGTSGPGRDLAARTAEGIFTGALTLEGAQTYYADVKTRAQSFNRSPDELVILPGITTIVGRTEAEAIDKEQYLQSLLREDVGMSYLEELLGMSLSGCSPDDALPERPSSRSELGMFKTVTALARDERLTIRQLYRRLAGSYGKLTLVGSVDQVVETMGRWYRERGCDGFILQPPVLPHDMDDITNLLVPALRDAGLMRGSYTGTTLRNHLGLARPQDLSGS